MTESRKLAAILAADVVGFSRLTGADEDRTLARLRALRSDLIDPTISVYKGRVVKRTGDGVLVEFRSVVDAVRCAIEVQNAMIDRNAGVSHDRRIEFRIGIHLGDVVEESDGDLMGDGVNIAARLEGIAQPGRICLSEDAYRQVKSRLDLAISDLGETNLKNIAEPMRVFSVQVGGVGPQVAKSEASTPIELSLPDKPSIVVLPFLNISADSEQSYFVDGLTEDLITDLSKVPELFVIARNSSFAYRGRSVDTRQIARELGVKYVLEGSVRRVSNRVRINAQLIEAEVGGHIWADRFDRDLSDIFAAQDEVIGKIVEALVGKLAAAKLKERYRPANLEAYDLCLRGRAEYFHSPEAGVAAIPLLERAIALDPNYAEAYRWLAIVQTIGWAYLNHPVDSFRQQSMAAAERAVELDPSGSHWVLGFILLYERRWDEAAREFDISLRLNPNDADTWVTLADLKSFEGRGTEAIACAQAAMRLNPRPPSYYFWVLGLAEFTAGQYEAAVRSLRNEATYRTESRNLLAAALVQLDRQEEACEEAKLYLATNPNFKITHWVETQPYRDIAMRDRIAEGMRKAGLPE